MTNHELYNTGDHSALYKTGGPDDLYAPGDHSSLFPKHGTQEGYSDLYGSSSPSMEIGGKVTIGAIVTGVTLRIAGSAANSENVYIAGYALFLGGLFVALQKGGDRVFNAIKNAATTEQAIPKENLKEIQIQQR